MTVIQASIIDQLLINFGYLAVFLAVGIESLGIPVPGETMLITASIYAGATHNLTIQGVIAASIAGRDHRRQHRIHNRLQRGLPVPASPRPAPARQPAPSQDRPLPLRPLRRPGRLLRALRVDSPYLRRLPRRRQPHALATLLRLQRRRGDRLVSHLRTPRLLRPTGVPNSSPPPSISRSESSPSP